MLFITITRKKAYNYFYFIYIFCNLEVSLKSVSILQYKFAMKFCICVTLFKYTYYVNPVCLPLHIWSTLEPKSCDAFTLLRNVTKNFRPVLQNKRVPIRNRNILSRNFTWSAFKSIVFEVHSLSIVTFFNVMFIGLYFVLLY